ncbi:hypothetical protein MJT46_013715 [Ovis ammon polii x Ovis aries]|nr:hypothetical protein MJT46_013715 [Ovis ammon polii x Ovis aries]
MDTKGQDQTSPLDGQRLHKGKQTHLHILFIYPKGRKRNGDVNPGAGGTGHVHSEVTGSIQPPPLMGKSGEELIKTQHERTVTRHLSASLSNTISDPRVWGKDIVIELVAVLWQEQTKLRTLSLPHTSPKDLLTGHSPPRESHRLVWMATSPAEFPFQLVRCLCGEAAKEQNTQPESVPTSAQGTGELRSSSPKLRNADVHTMRGLAMAIFSIVFALETRFRVEIQHSDSCHNTRPLFDLRLTVTMTPDTGQAANADLDTRPVSDARPSSSLLLLFSHRLVNLISIVTLSGCCTGSFQSQGLAVANANTGRAVRKSMDSAFA